ncbi:MAG: hypothetical protein J5659_04750 [Clostridia bacterium]|nr:hypothetical protein [Clostridia bacterium]
MKEKEFLTLYEQADEETKKQVRELLGIEPDPIDYDIDFDFLLIGYQNIVPVIDHREILQRIMDTRRSTNCIDAFLYGIMTGKRAERAKKRRSCCR